MNQEIKARWVDALRSGDYEQGRGTLRRGDRFCCLGVLTDLAVGAGVLEDPELYGLDGTYYYEDYLTSDLHPKVMEWAGINRSGYIKGANISLIELNDAYRLSFDHIAIVIEEEF